MGTLEVIKMLSWLIPTVVAGFTYIRNSVRNATKTRLDVFKDILNQAFDFAEGLARVTPIGRDEKFNEYFRMVRELSRTLGLGRLSSQEEDAAKAWAKMRANQIKPKVTNGVNTPRT